jgi:sigma-B regulation protein RsbU (phosphoserine phosphatase)
MLPPPDAGPGIRFASYYGPLHKISGDFFDIIEFPDGRTGILIVDVSGHGIPAALITIMIKFLVSQYGTNCGSAAELLARLNTELARVIKTGDYIAAFYLIMDKENVIRYSSAGNNSALVLEASGAGLYELADEGLFLGLMENPPVRYNEREARLKPGDRVILFTDGIIEQRNEAGELYGEERFHSAILANRGESSEALVKRLIDDSKRFSGTAKQNDDITLLIVDITG